MKESHKDLLIPTVDSPEKLDQCWEAYEATKDERFVIKVISVLDEEDKVRRLLEHWFKFATPQERTNYLPRLADWMFPMKINDFSIDGPLDLDLHVALLARDGKLKFDELPIQLSSEDLIRLAMKSAAIWSLVSMSQQDKKVADICLSQAKILGGAARLHLV